ncbi:MAG: DUF4166 domain-containing protein [Dongiaceae bacterium]
MTILSAFAPPRDKRLLRGLMGRSFDRLSGAVRDLHGTEQIGYWRGLCQVKRGGSVLSKLVGWWFHFPPAGFYPRMSVTVLRDKLGEVWMRGFDRHDIKTRLKPTAPGARIVRENFGLVEFDLKTSIRDGALTLQVAGMRTLGIPTPRFLWPHLIAEESNEDGWFRFDIKIDLPWREPLIHYLGWLEAGARQSKAERAI